MFMYWKITSVIFFVSVRKEYALNMRAYNVELMQALRDDATVDPDTNPCEQKWEEQTADQMAIMIANAEVGGNQRALDAYEGIWLIEFFKLQSATETKC